MENNPMFTARERGFELNTLYFMISNKIFKSSQRGYLNKRRHFTEAQVKAKQVKCVQPKSQMVKNHKLSSHAMLAKKY